jgi:magnesium transporter
MGQKIEHVSEYLTSSVPTARPGDTAAEVLQSLLGRRFDSVNSAYVIDEEGKLVGAAPLSGLYAAPQGAKLNDIMQIGPPFVLSGADREEAVSLAIREELSAIPVVNSDGRFLGVFPPRAIMGVLRQEHLEDLHHMAGIWQHSEEARQALQAPPLKRVRYRLPCLIVGLIGSMLATSLVAQFEHTLRAQIAIAFFIPAIVYPADAVGIQSEAVAVRGLSLTQFGIGRLLIGELSTGVLMGLALALLAGLFVVAASARLDFAFAVGISLLFACGVATTIGLFLPWVFARAGWDPALASEPVATIIQDVLSLLIYFGVASLIV